MKKKKKNARIRNISILVILIVAVIVAFNTASKDEYADTRQAVLDKYIEYDNTELITYSDYLESQDEVYVADTAKSITLKADEYSEADMDGIETEDDVVWTAEEGTVTYTFDVKKAGLYWIGIEYYPDTNSTQSILRNLYINGEKPFDACEGIVFDRIWNDDNKAWLMNTDGNQAAPTQVQVEGASASIRLHSTEADTIGDYMFWFKSGENNVTLESTQSRMGIGEISLIPATEIKSYEEYYEYWAKEQDAPVIEANSVKGGALIVQAEDTVSKTTSSLSPNNDRTSVGTQPYDPTYIVYNTIGGENWATAGQGMTWEVEVEESGLYKIAMRYKQYLNRGFYSARYLTINGELPFAEAAEIKFQYDPDWTNGYLGDENGDYYFYLEKGTNVISMTATLGSLTSAVELVSESVDNLNDLYRQLTAITGSDPDQYRDYQITVYVPNMVSDLEREYTRLNAVVGAFGEEIDSANKTSSVAEMMEVMIKLIDDPEDIAKYQSNFSDKLSALADWVNSINNLPLELDYVMVCGDGYRLPRANGTFFENVAHTWNSFLGSYTNDFKVHAKGSENVEKEVLDVWVTVDTRSAYDIIQKLINDAFKDAAFEVNLSMVNGDTLLPATVAGKGPDVAIQSSYSMPTNFAYRGAAYDLTQFEDFEEVYERFPAETRKFFEYEGGVYGIPDQLSFPVMLYRTDVLDAKNLEVPETWEDLIALIPYLEADNMSVYLASNEYMTLGGGTSSTTIPVNMIFMSLLYQNGYDIYNEDHTATLLDQNDQMMVFKDWTEFYTNQGLDYNINVVTRFRTGEVPVIVADYTWVNTINLSAPEIAGKWAIAKIPGTIQEDGSVDHSAAAMVGSSFIVASSVEQNGMEDEAWEFLKWWTSEETQSNYSMELKAENGEAAEFPMANMAAIENGSLKEEIKEVVLSILPDLKAEPQIPGGYITGRTIRNAFVSVVTENSDPIDTLYLGLDAINTEITNKRQEFGLSTAE
ncbi:MAG: extracellular solute-binding protein [Lachnospiraceae bacterium]|nr:extracellular solute-binding protein [Lachnospiraceae bacterium]